MSAAVASTERRYQVFISSTYLDLVDERREVMQAVLEMDCLPAGMELFAASNDDQWTLIQEVIDQSDYYIVIVGGRYGSISEEGISYTEKEYDYAVSKGIPVMGFVHANPDEIIAGKTGARAERTRTARRLPREGQDSHHQDLHVCLRPRLGRSPRTQPHHANHPSRGVGPRRPRNDTRAPSGDERELRAALADLQKERAEDAVTAVAELDLSYAHGDDEVSVALSYTGYTQSFNKQSFTGEIDYSWDDIIRTLGPFMIDEASEGKLRDTWNSHIRSEILDGKHEDAGWEPLSSSVARRSDRCFLGQHRRAVASTSGYPGGCEEANGLGSRQLLDAHARR